MSGWIIAGFLVLLLALLLFCSVSIEAAFAEEFSARAGFLFFHYRIWPRPEKKQAPARKEEPAAKKKPSKIKELLRKRGVSGFLELLRAFSRAAYGSAKKLLSHTVIRLLHLNLTVGGEDAAQTAVDYGKACGLVSTALTALLSAAKYRERHVNVRVTPDFQNGSGSVQFHVLLKIKLFFLLSAVLSALIDMIKIYLKFRKESGRPDQKEKAVL
ncbi:DUF2953 domain-containing protein [Caproiciproducens sp. NJN-50]|uniref:DUF2953 domain-containing protein n=1 Tax=Acutalibacteraceae TaxID=3082771 RepID=UPI000FFE189F|nr:MULTISPECIES: DUF2953 domain-containing protein [Acutalibacteraceae]QAT49409.1 DUF2953 domain-containing protein [Caproiciproducens sp. NJN-50]